MPRKPACDYDDIINVICASKETVIIGHTIAFPSEKVWVDLCQKLNNKISPKYLYTFVKTNRHNVWQALSLYTDVTNIPKPTSNSDSSEGTESHSSFHCYDIQFEFSLSFQSWMKIWPEKVIYNDQSMHTNKREYTILKPGAWTHILNEEIWKNSKLSCTLKFRRAKVYPNVISHYIDILGCCTECGAELSIKVEEIPEIAKPVVLKAMICNIDDSLHTGKSKRKLSGDLRRRVSKELWEGQKQAHVWRAAEAYKMMDVGDPEPSHLPNLATLRKAKQEFGDKELMHKDPIHSLHLLKYSVPQVGSIHNIGLDKFFCHYWTPSQMQVYQIKSKNLGSYVSFDATGSIVRKLKRPVGISGHIFLYQGVLCSCGDHIPVVQMLSESHTINSIAQWLTEWKQAGATVPKEAVCDFSLALLGALVKAFTPYPDLKTYINECFGVLARNVTSNLPPCFIRIDVAHCIKLISRWECLRQAGNRVKEFYLRAMAQLLQSTSLDDARELIHSISVVAFSESEGNDDRGTPVVSETCKAQLKRRIAEGYVLPTVTEDDYFVEIKEQEDKQIQPCQTDLKMWATEICERSKMLAANHGDRDNLHFLPELVPNVIRMACYLPIWTAIMVPYFKSVNMTASSANVEAEFKNIKDGLLKHESLPIRTDRFVIRHLEFMEGKMRLSSAPKKKTECSENMRQENGQKSNNWEENQQVHIQSGDESSLQEQPVENWKGLSIPPKKRLSYLTPCSEWLHMDTNCKGKKRVRILKNGNHLAKKPIKVNKMLVSIINTCAFDSFCQCLCCAFLDSGLFSNYVNQENNVEIFELVQTIVTKGVGKEAYTIRAKILSGIFEYVQLKSGVRQVNAECNIEHIISRTMREVPSAIMTTQCSSVYCIRNITSSRTIPLLPINGHILETNGLSKLQLALEDGLNLNVSKCLKPLKAPQECPDGLKVQDASSMKFLCNGSVTHSCTTGQVLCIEISAETQYTLSEIPVNINLDSHLFILRGVVAFIPGTGNKSLGHYVAYCRRKFNGWEKYDDLCDCIITVSAKTKMQPHVVIFTKEE